MSHSDHIFLFIHAVLFEVEVRAIRHGILEKVSNELYEFDLGKNGREIVECVSLLSSLSSYSHSIAGWNYHLGEDKEDCFRIPALQMLNLGRPVLNVHCFIGCSHTTLLQLGYRFFNWVLVD